MVKSTSQLVHNIKRKVQERPKILPKLNQKVHEFSSSDEKHKFIRVPVLNICERALGKNMETSLSKTEDVLVQSMTSPQGRGTPAVGDDPWSLRISRTSWEKLAS